jgi:DNA-binding beta-propeller fold protein YncE
MTQRRTRNGAAPAAACMGILMIVLLANVRAASASFVTFETGQVRPLALSPDGTHLFAVNTPDNHLEIFDVGSGGLTHSGSVSVGLEPVAVAARTDTEVWVVNHLSDSVSIVDVGATPPQVVRTLLVGDEPRDIVFAGPGGNRAFITTAHRGQNRPGFDPQLTTPGVGRADVFVFDASNLGSTLEGVPLTVVTLFGDTPRALAVSPDGNTVYAAVFESGNQTTSLSEGVICDGGSGAAACNGGQYPGGLPAPNSNLPEGITGPETGLIVKFNGTHWVDRACQGGVNRAHVCKQDSDCPASACGRIWDAAMRFSLPDKDVFAIDASANPPVETAFFTDVGTVLFDMAVNPVSGKVYVSNSDAHNEVRFEGPGGGGSTVRGHLHEARITVLSGGTVTPRHLNKHIDYSVVPSPPGVKDNSLATPLGMAVSSDGTTLYVAAFGSSKIGVFNTTALENDTFVPDGANNITVNGGGPTGIVLDEAHGFLYVLTRFDNGIAVINTTAKAEVDHLPLFDPEPPSVVNGRRFLYDATYTSSNGEASCSSCHVFGDFDSLAWDLGNPDNTVMTNPNPIRVDTPGGGFFFNVMKDFHPLKGPMTTQSLRGMANHGPMHWRGDRTGGNDPGGDPLSEDQAFKKFNVAFEGLLGRSGPLTSSEMQAFTDFILQVTYPPNPIRNLDNTLTPQQQAGRDFFNQQPFFVDTFANCNGCHRLDPAAGFFGTDGFSSFENEPQFFKIAHLRNLYQKVGMFGMPPASFFNAGDNGDKGPQVRGFGFLHDGSVDTVFRFLQAIAFDQRLDPPFPNPGGFPAGAAGDTLRQEVEAFLLAMDSNLKPIVGQQITLTSGNAATVSARLDLLNAQAPTNCDLIVKGTVGGVQRGWYKTSAGFVSDRAAEPPLSDASLRALATSGQDLTYTCVPPGSGERIGVDRDGDTFYDSDERDAGSDAANPGSTPCGTPGGIVKPKVRVSKNLAPAGDERITLQGQAAIAGTVNPPATGFRFVVQDSQGGVVFSRNVPAGSPLWGANRRLTRWTFNDRDGTVFPGSTKVIVQKTRTPGVYKFTVTAKNDNYQVASAALPLQLFVVLGNSTGQCAHRAFNPAGSVAPACKMSTSGNSVSCK